MNDKECGAQYGVKDFPALVLFRKFDESPLVYSGSWTTNEVVTFLSTSSIPTLIEFSEEYIEPIFRDRQPVVFLFRSKEDSDRDFSKVFADAAKELKGKILFAVSGVKEGIQ